jgi:hypothetical protein
MSGGAEGTHSGSEGDKASGRGAKASNINTRIDDGT